MDRNLSPSLLSLALLLFLSACSGGDSPEALSSDRTVSLGEISESHPLVDDLKILDSVTEIVSLDGGRYLVQDQEPSVTLFRDYEMVRRYGAVGEGPCEYSGISAIDTSGDSLFVLSASQVKILTYRISTGECLGETSNEELSGRAFLERRGDQFYTARANYITGTPDSTELLYRLNNEGEMESLGLELGTVDPAEAFVTMVAPGLNFASSGDLLYAYYPFTDQMIHYNTANGSLESSPLRIDIRREAIEKAGENVEEIVNIIQNDFQFVQHLVATDRWIALSVGQQNGSDEDARLWVQFYEPDGTFIGEAETENRMVGARGNQLILLREASDASADQTYELLYREVTVE